MFLRQKLTKYLNELIKYIFFLKEWKLTKVGYEYIIDV